MLIELTGETPKEKKNQWRAMALLSSTLSSDRSAGKKTIDKHQRIYDYMRKEYLRVAA